MLHGGDRRPYLVFHLLKAVIVVVHPEFNGLLDHRSLIVSPFLAVDLRLHGEVHHVFFVGFQGIGKFKDGFPVSQDDFPLGVFLAVQRVRFDDLEQGPNAGVGRYIHLAGIAKAGIALAGADVAGDPCQAVLRFGLHRFDYRGGVQVCQAQNVSLHRVQFGSHSLIVAKMRRLAVQPRPDFRVAPYLLQG